MFTESKLTFAVALALALFMGIGVAEAQPKVRVPEPQLGRWQIVNGTPEMTQNIMLLDTSTGDSWLVCSTAGGRTSWCALKRPISFSEMADRANGRKRPTIGPPGRWKVVNGTPEMTRNIMLLDTATGESWETCESQGATEWCYMQRSEHPPTNRSDDPTAP